MDNFSKVMTILILAIGALIAYQQFVLAKEKLKLELFEKRFSVFSGARKFLSIVLRDAKFELNDFFEFRAATSESSFLFGTDITDYLLEVDRHALHLRTLQNTRVNWTEESRAAKINDEARELAWLCDQLPLLKEKFAPYMKFKTWA